MSIVHNTIIPMNQPFLLTVHINTLSTDIQTYKKFVQLISTLNSELKTGRNCVVVKLRTSYYENSEFVSWIDYDGLSRFPSAVAANVTITHACHN